MLEKDATENDSLKCSSDSVAGSAHTGSLIIFSSYKYNHGIFDDDVSDYLDFGISLGFLSQDDDWSARSYEKD